jgi:S-adenosylmethionine uptake transporter
MFLTSNDYKSRTIQAIILIILGYFGYTVADLCAKYLQADYSTYQILAISGSSGFIICSLWLGVKNGLHAFFPKNLNLHILRGLSVMGTAIFMVKALETLPLADFYGIVFALPFLTLIMAILFLGEKVGWRRWTAVSVGFAGVIILAGPQFDTLGIGFIYAFLGSLCAAANIIFLRKIGRDAPIPLFGVYPFLFITVLNVILLLSTNSYVPFDSAHLPVFIIHGPIIVLSLICISLGYTRTPETAIVAPFHYTQIIWGVLFGWVFFQTLPTQTTLLGLCLIIGAGLYSIWREYTLAHQKQHD